MTPPDEPTEQNGGPEETAIWVRGLRKEFDGTVAVRNLDLTVDPGEIYAFLGPNGAGKTTTIKIINGLMAPTKGEVYVVGLSLRDRLNEVREHLAYVPDQPYIYDKLTGREFLEFTGRLYRMDEAAIEEKIDRYRQVFEMSEYLDDLGETYSHGMKQRVVLSATFMHEPDVILVDEPLVGLDPESSRLVRRLFREQVETGVSIFMSTHVLSIAEDVADRIAVIDEGELIEEGTLEELRMRTGGGDGGLESLYMQITGENA